MENAKTPDSDTDWQAIDIFVFSNGQQYSPPRKYHLQTEDINLWKSTLSFLAKSQYGPYHSTIDLYTTEGTRVANPLQLSNGGTYVAVQPPDTFIEAGYEKYLIKASRSWEKRRIRRNEMPTVSDDPYTTNNIENIDKVMESDALTLEAAEERVILKSRASSFANEDFSTIIKPQLLPAPQRKPDSLLASRQTEKRKSLIAPIIAKKITPSLLPTPNPRSSISRKRDSLRLNQAVKVSSKPEEHSTFNKQPLKLSKVIRPPSKSRESSISPEAASSKVQAANETKALPPIKLNIPKNDEKLPTNVANLKNIFEDKEIIMVPNLNPSLHSQIPSMSICSVLQYPFKGNPLISVNPIQSVLLPVREIATTTIAENSEEDIYYKRSDIKINVPNNDENVVKLEVLESINIDHKMTKNACESDFIENLEIEANPDPGPNSVQNADRHINLLNNSNNMNDPKEKDNVEILDSPPRQCSIKEELPFTQDNANCVATKSEEHLNEKIGTSNSGRSRESHKMSPPNPATITSKLSESQYIERKIEQTQVNGDLSPTVTDKVQSDQYKATLKRGDIVNVKLSIEIENQDGSFTRHHKDLNCHSVTIIHSDKGSQSNIDDQIIAENKSLLALIAKDYNMCGLGDNQRTVVVQYNCCKYCHEYNAAKLDQETNKKYVILLPIGKFEEMEWCNCNDTPNKKVEETKECCHGNDTLPPIQRPSLVTPLKPSYSCTSLQRLSNIPATIQNVCSSLDTKSIENLIRKKSVAINEGSALNTRVPSKSIQEIDVKTQLMTVGVESVGIASQIIMKDVWTQTDWCDIVLQAQLLSDGHYSFHLPPLELLKCYKLT